VIIFTVRNLLTVRTERGRRMIEYIIEKFDYDAEWRYKRAVFIRFCVSLLLLLLFLFSFNMEWQENRPITGYYNEYISVHGTAVQSDIRTLDKTLEILPEWLVESHRESGRIFLQSEEFPPSDFTEVGEKYRTVGTFTGSNDRITILILENKDEMGETLIHEYGHYLDSLFLCTESTGFKGIYQEEKEKYFDKVEKSSYHISCASEYFAGAFTMYFTHKRALKKYCPYTYEYLKTMIERN